MTDKEELAASVRVKAAVCVILGAASFICFISLVDRGGEMSEAISAVAGLVLGTLIGGVASFWYCVKLFASSQMVEKIRMEYKSQLERELRNERQK